MTIDFSCRNYNFISGHRYLILISNANMGNSGSGVILFGAASYLDNTDYFPDGGLRYANGNRNDSVNNSGSCNPVTYKGCYVWGNPKNDLYFVLSNNAPPPPPPRIPVIFIPGIGGSEFKASQDIYWANQDNGHGGKYSYAYKSDEKIWVNQDKAVELGDDDYFDVLKLKADGVTPESPSVSLTGNLTSFGYGDIDNFFINMGYEKDKNFFVFPYDWRKDVRLTKDDLDSLIEKAKQKSGQTKVNLVVHSLGGLIARYYISDSSRAVKVNKLIELGVPHLGTVSGLKTLLYGSSITYNFYGLAIPIIPSSEIRDILNNTPSLFQLLPSSDYFDFYNNSTDLPYPFKDDRDIDNNKTTGALNFDQTKDLLKNLNINMTVFDFGEQFHNAADSILNQTNNVKVYEIVGSSQPTLGQIYETWRITWPVNLISKTEELYINGDDTVPLFSASLKSDSKDISGATKIYYVDQRHEDLPSTNGLAMQTVKSLLNDDNALPVEVKSLKIDLEGEQLSLDDGELDLYDGQNKHCGLNSNGEIEENIPDVTCTNSGNTKHAFVKKKAAKVKVTATRKKSAVNSKTINLKKRTYKQDKISKTTLYKTLPLTQSSKLEFNLDPTLDTSPTLILFPDETKSESLSIIPTSEATGSAALDQSSPTTTIQISGTKNSSGVYTDPVTVTLTGNDDSSGILKIEYSLDNGLTVQTYKDPFIISTPGKTTIQVKSIDKLGNEEIPQTITIEIAALPSPTPTPTPGPTPLANTNTTSNSGKQDSTTANTSEVGPDSSEVNSSKQSLLSPPSNPEVLGISKILDNNLTIQQSNNSPTNQILGGLLIVSGGIATIASLGFALTFIHPTPK